VRIEEGRRSVRNGREVKRRKEREQTRGQGKLDRERKDAADVIIGKESLGKEQFRV